MEVIGDKRGNVIFFAIRNDKKVAGTCGCKVILPARTREDIRLGTIGTRGASFGISIHGLVFYLVSFHLLVQDHGHGRDRGRGMRWDVFDESGYDG